MIDVKAKTGQKQSIQVEDNKEYFACDTKHFFIFHKETQNWRCAVTGLEVLQPLPRGGKGVLNLHFDGMLMTTGRWGRGEIMNDVLDFFNSGDWRKWSQE